MRRKPAERGAASAVLAAVFAATARVLSDAGPADATLRAFFRAHPSLGRRDRHWVAETVYDVLRHRRRYAQVADAGVGAPAERLAWLSLAATGGAEAMRAAPPPWVSAALAALRTNEGGWPPAVRHSLPDWLHARMVAGWPEAVRDARLAALNRPAPLDLRVNLARADVASVLASLAAEGIEARALPDVPGAIRVEGKPALETSAAFRDGLFEVQDAGSQMLALLAGPRRGQTVVDFCAGAGGKTLAMAAAMRSTGQVFAIDVSVARLARLRPRLARCGATNVQTMAIAHERDERLARLRERADVVLVDAPCSGLGTLRRHPELKWRLREADLQALGAQQRAILTAAARLVKPGGTLVYATCSLLAEENDAVAHDFARAHPGFRPQPAAEALARAQVRWTPTAEDDPALRLSPERDETDGFFAMRWRREA